MGIRRHVRILYFLSLSVALLFGIRELPKLMSLTDDVSNDGEVIELAAADASSDMASETGCQKSLARPAFSKDAPRFWTCRLPRGLRLREGRRLLQSLSLLRV